MNSAPRLAVRTMLLFAAASASLLAPPATSLHGRDGNTIPRDEVAGMRPEGRLRKLHLVRPDLIPYPIAYEVYC
jgi:hypothetical protein